MARWAHGTMDYRHAPHLRPVMNPRRRRRRMVRRKGVGGWYSIPAAPRRRGRRNPARGGGGGIGIGTIALIGGAALLFFKPDILSGLFGGGVPSGFTQVANGLYRGPDGAIYARNPSTGQMVKAPVGTTPTSATDLLTRAGIAIAPAAANALASWVGGLFSGGSPTSTTTPRPSSQGGAGSGGSGASSFPVGAIGAALPALPAIGSVGASLFTGGTGPDATLPPLDSAPSLWEGGDFFGGDDLWGDAWGSDLTFGDPSFLDTPSMFDLNTDDWLSGYDWSGDWGGLDSFDTLPVVDDWAFDWGDPLVADASFDWGFMGLGRRPGFRRSRGYAKFGRRPASTR